MNRIEEEIKLLDLKMDIVFQELFGKQKNSNITSHFLSLILGREIKDIEFKKEKFGKEIQDAFESIEKENKKLSKKVLERQAEQLKKRAINNSTDIRTGF